MRRLYLQVYLTIVGSLVLVVLTAGLIWHFIAGVPPFGQQFEVAGEIIAEFVPAVNAPPQVQQQALDRLAERLGGDLALYGRNNEPLAAAGRPLPAPNRIGRTGGWLRTSEGPAISIPLPDGRRLVARLPPRQRPTALLLAGFLGAIALVVALGARPVVRRLTGRLERLQRGVESLGAGDLRARVKVEGRDEVARLAQSFNQAAARIESLVDAHKMLLANASHELRTPLTRIRLGLELAEATPERKAQLAKDIAELDQLVDEILLLSRLDATEQLDVREDVDLAALAAEECARYDDCTLDGEAVSVIGDPRLLRRMVRNLLENAKRHGTPPVRVKVARADLLVTLDVADSGKGVPANERERVFTPFHRLGEEPTGAGLGLALVRQIARLHGGDAVVLPRDQTCFRVSLPAAG
jgi:two-component system, OmpR family, sensor histidine kinase RstB